MVGPGWRVSPLGAGPKNAEGPPRSQTDPGIQGPYGVAAVSARRESSGSSKDDRLGREWGALEMLLRLPSSPLTLKSKGVRLVVALPNAQGCCDPSFLKRGIRSFWPLFGLGALKMSEIIKRSANSCTWTTVAARMLGRD
jgi:hypothetical protein